MTSLQLNFPLSYFKIRQTILSKSHGTLTLEIFEWHSLFVLKAFLPPFFPKFEIVLKKNYYTSPIFDFIFDRRLNTCSIQLHACLEKIRRAAKSLYRIFRYITAIGLSVLGWNISITFDNDRLCFSRF